MNKYDAFLHSNKPSSEELGLLPITMVYYKDIRPESTVFPYSVTDTIDYDKLGLMCQKALDTDTIMLLDFELWPPGDLHFIEIARWVREHYSAIRFGFWWTRGHAEELQKYVDFVTVALYPHWADCAMWLDNADALLSQDFVNPLLVFLRPEYTKRVGEELRDQPIPECYWTLCRHYTETHPNVNGIIYWGGHKMAWPENGIPV